MPSHLGLLSNANTPLIITVTKEASHKVLQEDTDYIKQQITETLKTTREVEHEENPVFNSGLKQFFFVFNFWTERRCLFFRGHQCR